ncbi:MAG: ABC transporter permease [Verrucomicrobiales bacterium]
MPHLLGKIGNGCIAKARSIFYLSTMLCAGLTLSVKPSTWVFPLRNRLARQILFAGVQAVPFTIMVAALAGGMVYLQCFFWLQYTDKVEFLGRMVAALLFRELAPFLVTFIVIGASASAVTTELATMKTSGEVTLLEAQGIDIFNFLAVPRMIGLAVCVLGLSCIFLFVSIIASALGFILFNGEGQGPQPFLISVFDSVRISDWITLITKSVIPGLFMGAICSYEGLKVEGTSTEVPQAVSRAILRSISATVLVSTAVMLITYL